MSSVSTTSTKWRIASSRSTAPYFRDVRANQRAAAPLGDLRAGFDRRPDRRRTAAAAVHALPVPERLRTDRDARRALGRADGPRRAGDEERLLPLLLRLGRA